MLTRDGEPPPASERDPRIGASNKDDARIVAEDDGIELDAEIEIARCSDRKRRCEVGQFYEVGKFGQVVGIVENENLVPVELGINGVRGDSPSTEIRKAFASEITEGLSGIVREREFGSVDTPISALSTDDYRDRLVQPGADVSLDVVKARQATSLRSASLLDPLRSRALPRFNEEGSSEGDETVTAIPATDVGTGDQVVRHTRR